jgi:hypothetical protein
VIIPKKPSNKKQRIEALYDYRILNSGSETEFDNLTTLAGEICKAPIALVTMIDTNSQWFKSKIGLDEKQTPRD